MPSAAVLVIGGGPAGLEAARGVADLGTKAILVDRRDRLGGTPDEESYATLTPDLRPAGPALGEMISAVTDHPMVELHLGAQVTACSGSAGGFHVALRDAGGSDETVDVGAVIVATGFRHFDPGRETQMYGYYEFDDVITLPDLERMLRAHRVVRPSNGQAPERVCFIQCVGSRDRQIGNFYCSKVCCGVASKQAIEVRQLLPEARVFIFYIDMRTYGFWEDQIYWKAQEEYRVNYVRGIVTEVLKKGDRLVIRGEDTTMGRPVETPMDLVVLSVGMEPSPGTVEIARVLGLPREEHGFIATVGGPLDTVSTPVAGVYVAGAAAGPKDLEDSISMGGAAAMRAVAALRKAAAPRP